MNNDLLIIGAGSVGGFIANNLGLFEPEFKILGFLDDDPQKIGKEIFNYKIIGPISELAAFNDKNVNIVLGIASPQNKISIIKKLLPYNFNFPSFISKNTWLSENVKVGKGVIIYPGVSINYNTVIGDFVIINMNCALGHDILISSCSTLAPGVCLAGHTKIMEGVEIGIGAATKQNIVIGKNAIIGGKTMLIKNVNENEKIVGVPGRVI
ncbi:MAG: NeuD/PglB/VioB family sugar acetyltransferase [Ignavibacteriaceae bacterium]|nr:NeuD/PglB/VioB family sugar acetyltransferase [Ignavibacteriaceae bacterium]